MFRIVFAILYLFCAVSSATAQSYAVFSQKLLAEKPKGANFEPALEKSLTFLANQVRRKEGLPPFMESRIFQKAARVQALDLLLQNAVSHRSKSGATPRERIFSVLSEDRLEAFGENAARHRKPGSDLEKAQGLMRQWLASSGHRRNLLSRIYTHISSGVIRSQNGEVYAIQIFWKERALSISGAHFF